jgi:hypothetical protein
VHVSAAGDMDTSGLHVQWMEGESGHAPLILRAGMTESPDEFCKGMARGMTLDVLPGIGTSSVAGTECTTCFP